MAKGRFTVEELQDMKDGRYLLNRFNSTKPSTSSEHSKQLKQARTILKVIRKRQKKENTRKDEEKLTKNYDDDKIRTVYNSENSVIMSEKDACKKREKIETKRRLEQMESVCTQTEMDIETLIDEIDKEMNRNSRFQYLRNKLDEKAHETVKADPVLEMANELLEELDSEIQNEKYTQTDFYRLYKDLHPKRTNWPMPKRNVEARTDHIWPVGHRLHIHFKFKEK